MQRYCQNCGYRLRAGIEKEWFPKKIFYESFEISIEILEKAKKDFENIEKRIKTGKIRNPKKYIKALRDIEISGLGFNSLIDRVDSQYKQEAEKELNHYQNEANQIREKYIV